MINKLENELSDLYKVKKETEVTIQYTKKQLERLLEGLASKEERIQEIEAELVELEDSEEIDQTPQGLSVEQCNPSLAG